MSGDESDDEPLVLSSSTLDALKEFYTERDAHKEKFANLSAEAEENADGRRQQQLLSMEAFSEDWNQSQFWYSDDTATLLAKQLLDGTTADMTIAVVSAPSVFVALKKILYKSTGEDAVEEAKPKLVLLENDNRFSVFPEFVFYDFAQPLKLPPELKGTVDRLICDPPFLSEDCQTKAALSVRWLARSASNDGNAPRLVVCTGERMAPLVTKLYRSFGLRTTTYEPVHARGLSNEFYCYATFECGEWKWREIPDTGS